RGVALLLAAYVAAWLYMPTWLVLTLHGVGAACVLFLACASVPFLLLSMSAKRSASMAEVAFGLEEDMARGADQEMMKMAPGAPMDGMPRPEGRGGGAAGEAPVRVREQFPETLLWRPEVVTDDQGTATLDVELADSITTWRLTASAVTADGRLGAA